MVSHLGQANVSSNGKLWVKHLVGLPNNIYLELLRQKRFSNLLLLPLFSVIFESGSYPF
jgi:hypothetical protein